MKDKILHFIYLFLYMAYAFDKMQYRKRAMNKLQKYGVLS